MLACCWPAGCEQQKMAKGQLLVLLRLRHAQQSTLPSQAGSALQLSRRAHRCQAEDFGKSCSSARAHAPAGIATHSMMTGASSAWLGNSLASQASQSIHLCICFTALLLDLIEIALLWGASVEPRRLNPTRSNFWHLLAELMEGKPQGSTTQWAF